MQPVLNIRGRNSRQTAGFTLIELIFVVAIIAILLALAYPAYTDQIRKARRADAISSMMSTAQFLERCFTQNNSYASCGAPERLASADDEFHYDITMAVQTETTYRIQAEPKGAQASDPCGTLTLDYLANKTSGSETNRCWGDS
jgi:type IV pilus assembly protein PilE